MLSRAAKTVAMIACTMTVWVSTAASTEAGVIPCVWNFLFGPCCRTGCGNGCYSGGCGSGGCYSGGGGCYGGSCGTSYYSPMSYSYGGSGCCGSNSYSYAPRSCGGCYSGGSCGGCYSGGSCGGCGMSSGCGSCSPVCSTYGSPCGGSPCGTGGCGTGCGTGDCGIGGCGTGGCGTSGCGTGIDSGCSTGLPATGAPSPATPPRPIAPPPAGGGINKTYDDPSADQVGPQGRPGAPLPGAKSDPGFDARPGSPAPGAGAPGGAAPTAGATSADADSFPTGTPASPPKPAPAGTPGKEEDAVGGANKNTVEKPVLPVLPKKVAPTPPIEGKSAKTNVEPLNLGDKIVFGAPARRSIRREIQPQFANARLIRIPAYPANDWIPLADTATIAKK